MSDKTPRIPDLELIAAIERFLAENPGMTASAFGTQSINDPALVTDLKEGRELRRATRDRVLAFIGESRLDASAPKQILPTQPSSKGSRKSNASCKNSSTGLSETTKTAEPVARGAA